MPSLANAPSLINPTLSARSAHSPPPRCSTVGVTDPKSDAELLRLKHLEATWPTSGKCNVGTSTNENARCAPKPAAAIHHADALCRTMQCGRGARLPASTHRIRSESIRDVHPGNLLSGETVHFLVKELSSGKRKFQPALKRWLVDCRWSAQGLLPAAIGQNAGSGRHASGPQAPAPSFARRFTSQKHSLRRRWALGSGAR
jgi:hypothetical protein